MLPKHRHREAHHSRQVRLGCEVMEDRVLLSAALPDYHFTAPALVAGTTQHNAPSSIGAFTKTPGGTTYGSVSNGSMQAVLPAAPSFTATAVSATQINLAWKPVAGATGYLVDVWINGAWKQIGSFGSGSTGCVVTGLSPKTTYYFNVAAYNAAGPTWANFQSATTAKAVLPTTPSFTATAVSATQINLAWKPVAGATGYLVYVWINGASKQIGSLGSGGTGFAVTGLSPKTTYYFDVAAYNAAGTTWASYQSATTPPSMANLNSQQRLALQDILRIVSSAKATTTTSNPLASLNSQQKLRLLVDLMTLKTGVILSTAPTFGAAQVPTTTSLELGLANLSSQQKLALAYLGLALELAVANLNPLQELAFQDILGIAWSAGNTTTSSNPLATLSSQLQLRLQGDLVILRGGSPSTSTIPPLSSNDLDTYGNMFVRYAMQPIPILPPSLIRSAPTNQTTPQWIQEALDSSERTLEDVSSLKAHSIAYDF